MKIFKVLEKLLILDEVAVRSEVIFFILKLIFLILKSGVAYF